MPICHRGRQVLGYSIIRGIHIHSVKIKIKNDSNSNIGSIYVATRTVTPADIRSSLRCLRARALGGATRGDSGAGSRLAKSIAL